jgi:hypothetical protein
MVDEADKAPLEVVCILKSLVEDGEMRLSDGRLICRPHPGIDTVSDPTIIPLHPDFRMIVLANRPGYPFLGNDFFRECGDVFSCHVVDNPDAASEIELVRRYAPSVPEHSIAKMTAAFADLRRLVDEGVLSYPYSSRELVNIVCHLERFPRDSVGAALANVFAFDVGEEQTMEAVEEVLSRHGLTVAADPLGLGALDGAVSNLALPTPIMWRAEGLKDKGGADGKGGDGDGLGAASVGVREYWSGERCGPIDGSTKLTNVTVEQWGAPLTSWNSSYQFANVKDEELSGADWQRSRTDTFCEERQRWRLPLPEAEGGSVSRGSQGMAWSVEDAVALSDDSLHTMAAGSGPAGGRLLFSQRAPDYDTVQVLSIDAMPSRVRAQMMPLKADTVDDNDEGGAGCVGIAVPETGLFYVLDPWTRDCIALEVPGM